MKIIVLSLLLSMALFSCMPTQRMVNTSVTQFKHGDFSRADFLDKEIGILPVSSYVNDDLIYFDYSLDRLFISDYGREKVKTSNELTELLQDEKLFDDYYVAVHDNPVNVELLKQIISDLGTVLGTDYFLYNRKLTLEEVEDMYGKDWPRYPISQYHVQCQVWDVSSGKIVWEGIGGAAKNHHPALVSDQAAQHVYQMIGFNNSSEAMENLQVLEMDMREATNKTLFGSLLGSIGGGILLALLIITLI